MIRDVSLYPYQVEAKDLIVARGRALLALVMGAGKTLVSIAAMEELIDNGAVRRGIVVVPSSLKYQWQDEIERFTGKRALVIDGTPNQRLTLYGFMHHYEYTIMGYSNVTGDWKLVRDMDFDFIIADEASALKSFTSKRSKYMKFMAKRADVVLGLTGQPIENRAEDLFSIMQFVDPTVLGNWKAFDRACIVRNHFGREVRFENLPAVRRKLDGVMYRKTRDDLKGMFPDVVPMDIPVPMRADAARVYRKAAEFTLAKLEEAKSKFGNGFDLARHYGQEDGSAEMQMAGQIMSGLLVLRLAANDPNLVCWSAERFLAGDGQGSKLAAQFLEDGVLDKVKPGSAKLDAFKEQAEEILSEDPANKLVVFTTFKEMVKSVQAITEELTTSVSFTGDMNAREKHAAKTQFKTDPATRLFVSSDAGGYGVDIPEANFLASLDLPWSTGAYEQREARIIRVSSKWDHVTIMNFLSRGTVDEWMFGKIKNKNGISKAFLDGQHTEEGMYVPTLDSLTEFLSAAVV
jgi:SNF2 family DNA or RNA helicase